MLSTIAVVNQILLIELSSNSIQLPQPTNCLNNVDFTNQGLDTWDNIVFRTNKDKKKRQTMRMQAVKYIKTANAKI